MVDNNPLVSIIVPIYNVEECLNRCLESLLNQSYRKTEIILVDDGSTDNSSRIADCYARYDRRIHVIHKTNGGLSSARNVGLRYVAGEWIAFVDSDDYVDKNYISTLLQLAQSNNAEIAMCNYYRVKLDGTVSESLLGWTSEVLTNKEAIDDIFTYKRAVSVWQSIFRADLFYDNNILFPEGREYEDISTKVKTLFFANKVAFTNEKLYYYVEREGSITNQSFKESVFHDKLSAARDVENLLEENEADGFSEFFGNYKYLIVESVLTDMTRRNVSQVNVRKIWRATRRQLASLYPRTKFPSARKRIRHGVLLALSSSRWLYGVAYRFRNGVWAMKGNGLVLNGGMLGGGRLAKRKSGV